MVAAAAGAVLMLGAHLSGASAWRTMHAYSCAVQSGAIVYNSAGQIGNTSTTTSAELVCPMDSDSFVASTTPGVTLQVSGFSNVLGGFQAKACVTFVGGGGAGGSCGPAPFTVSGVQQLRPDTSTWTSASPSDYPYVAVHLSPTVSGSSSTFWGYKMSIP
jgi:hypothetical protein